MNIIFSTVVLMNLVSQGPSNLSNIDVDSISKCTPITFVPVGDLGNIPFNGSGLGTVNHHYEISVFEITNCQYVEFLNSVATSDSGAYLFRPEMQSDATHGGIIQYQTSPGTYAYYSKANFSRKPVNYVSWGAAATFVNWLHSDRPSGPSAISRIQSGVYEMELSWPYGSAGRAPGARYALPSNSEWFKAAYFDRNLFNPQSGTYGAYWNYASRSNEEPVPSGALANGTAALHGSNVCNFNGAARWNGASNQGNVVTVGSSGGVSPYGAFDMNGNVAEWTQTRYCNLGKCTRYLFGGSAISFSSGVTLDGTINFSGLKEIGYAFELNGTNEDQSFRAWTSGFRVIRLSP